MSIVFVQFFQRNIIFFECVLAGIYNAWKMSRGIAEKTPRKCVSGKQPGFLPHVICLSFEIMPRKQSKITAVDWHGVICMI